MKIHVDRACLRTLRYWRKLLSENLHNLYSHHKIYLELWRTELAEHVAHMGDTRNAYTICVGNPERERPVPGPGCRWEDNKMGGSEIERDDAEWIDLALCGGLLCTQ
jgi:hypothetical protein